jgi:hypothetical protein
MSASIQEIIGVADLREETKPNTFQAGTQKM